MYSCGPLHMNEQRQDDQLEPTHCSPVPIRDVALKTCRKQRTIERGSERGSGISVLMARHDDDDDLSIYEVHSINNGNLSIYLSIYEGYSLNKGNLLEKTNLIFF